LQELFSVKIDFLSLLRPSLILDSRAVERSATVAAAAAAATVAVVAVREVGRVVPKKCQNPKQFKEAKAIRRKILDLMEKRQRPRKRAKSLLKASKGEKSAGIFSFHQLLQ